MDSPHDKPKKDNDLYKLFSDENDFTPSKPLNQALLEGSSPLKYPIQIEMTHYSDNNPRYSENKLSPQSFNEHFSISSIIGTLQIILTYILTDIRKKPQSFKIGVFSIFIVVAFLIVLQSAKQLTPALFIRLSEGQAGDSDLILRSIALENDTRLTNESYFSNPFHEIRLLDGVNIERICDSLEEVEGCSARWMMIGKTFKRNHSIKTFVIILDSQKEKSIGLGRNSKANSERLGENECALTESTMRALNIEDEYVDLNVDILNSLVSQESIALFGNSDHKEDESNEDLIINLKKKLKTLLNANLQQKLENFDNYSNFNEYFSDSTLSIFNNLDLFNNDFSFNDTNNVSFFKKNQENIAIFLDFALDSMLDTLNLTLHLKVKTTVKSPKGKWPSVMGNVILLDYHYITNLVLDNFLVHFKEKLETDPNYMLFSYLLENKALKEIMRAQTSKFDLKQYAMFEYLTLKNKMSIYSDEKTIDQKMVAFSNNFSRALGKAYLSQADIALSGVVKSSSVIKGFLDNVFAASVFLLLLLSILLIYSLMLSNIEEKTFEFGMLRALGFNKTHVIALLLIQALIYAVLGIFLAYFFSSILNGLICFIVFDFSLLGEDYVISDMALALGFGIGFIMPLISNILPIIRALSKTLRDSLDLFHREINVFRVNVMKLEKLGVSLYQTLNACIMIIMGFSSYYLAPKAFIMQDLPLFLAIMNMILIIFLLGFTVFLNLFESFLEKSVLKIILLVFFLDKKLEPIILKNIKGHHSRNLKTALMFSVTLSFLIFAGTGFKLQETVINDSLRVFIGSDMTAEIAANAKMGLDESAIRLFLEDHKAKYPDQIDSYTFVSIPLDQIFKLSFADLSPLSFFPKKQVSIKAIEKNFLYSVYSDFYSPTEYDESLSYETLSNGKRDCVSALYSPKNLEFFTKIHDVHQITSNQNLRNETKKPEEMKILRFLLPEGKRYFFGVEPTIPAMVFLTHLKFPSKITTMIAKMPGFGMFFSSYPTSAKMMLTSMETFQFMMHKTWKELDISKEEIDDYYEKLPKNMSYGIPKEKVLIKYKRSLNERERNELANGLRNLFKDMMTMLFDTEEFIQDSKDAFFYLDIFYFVVAVIAIILSFFLILVSFNSNVKEHVWEFGILRSLGLNKSQMTRIYVYEAVCLTAASGLIGTAVGICVALVLTMQYLTFAEIPLKFNFPVFTFAITFFSGIFTSILGSYWALREIRDKPIANIIKGLN